MTQFARPASDITTGNWTDEGASFNDGSLYTSIQETSKDDDTSYVLGDGDLTPETFEVKLDSVTDPTSNADHRVRLWGIGVGSGGGEKVDVFLYVATTLIATVANNWTPGRSAYAELNYLLSGTEADNIGDYADLRIRVIEDTIGAGEEFRITQAYFECPDAAVGSLTVNVSDSVGLTESIGRLEKAFIDLTDSVGLAETIQAVISDLQINLTDSISVAESVNALIVVPGGGTPIPDHAQRYRERANVRLRR